MAVEGDGHRARFLLFGVGQGLADHLLVAEVHPIEDADGDADFARAGLQFPGSVDDFHRRHLNAERGRRRSHCRHPITAAL